MDLSGFMRIMKILASRQAVMVSTDDEHDFGAFLPFVLLGPAVLQRVAGGRRRADHRAPQSAVSES